MKIRMVALEECREDGFSLIEMLVVMTIVSLTATIAFSSFHRRQPNSSPEAVARDVSHLAQMIRMEAINRHRRLPLTIDVQARTISDVDGKRRIAIPASTTFEVVTGKELVRSQHQASIDFFPDGSSSGGAIALSVPGSQEIVVRIPWLTGIPTILSGAGDEH